MTSLETRLSKASNSSSHVAPQRFSYNYSGSPRASSTTKVSERTRSLMSRAIKFKSKQFQLANPAEKIFHHSQPLIADRPRILGQNKEVEHLRKKLNETMSALDSQMLQVFHKQESNFLTAYKGVMRHIAQELDHYKAEIDKHTEEYKEGENGFLRKQLSVFSDEVEKILKVLRKLDEDNRDLKKKIVELTQDLKCEKELAMSIAKKNKMHQEMAKLFYKENKQLVLSKIEDYKNFNEEMEEAEGDNPEEQDNRGQDNKYYFPKTNKRESYDTSDNSRTKAAQESKHRIRFSDQKQYYSVGASETNRSNLKKEILETDRSVQYNKENNPSHIYSNSPYDKSIETEDKSLRNTLYTMLRPKLKSEFDPSDVVASIMAKMEQGRKTNKGIIKQNATVSFENEQKFASHRILSHKQTLEKSEMQTLKDILAESIEGAMRNLLSESEPSTNRNQKYSARSASISHREVLELLFNEKEINKAISSALDSVRSQNLFSNGNLLSKGNKAYNMHKYNGDDIDLKSQLGTNEEGDDDVLIQDNQNHSLPSDINISPGKARIKPLNLDVLNGKATFEEDQKQSQKSEEKGRYGNIPRSNNSTRQNSLTERGNKPKLRSLLKEDKGSQGSSEALYDKSPNDSQNGTFRSKSPLTKRIIVQNGKLMVQ